VLIGLSKGWPDAGHAIKDINASAV